MDSPAPEAKLPPSVALTFVVVRRERVVRTATLSDPIIKVGTDPRSQLALDDVAASRMHAVIEVTGPEATLIDLGSEIGTWVNGARVNRCKLREGDEVRIGTTLLRVDKVVATE